MKKSIGVILCICLVTSVLIGCETRTGTVTESNTLTERDKDAVMGDAGGSGAVGAATLGNAQALMEEENAGEIVSPQKEPGWRHWRQACISKAEGIEIESGFSLEFESRKAEEGYELTIYNSLGAIVLSEVYPREPGISWVTENVMEIAISAGSPARYVYYVDIKEDKVSDVYFNPILVGDEYVAYMEDGELILSDIFYAGQQDLLYMAIVRDFTETADPVSAIMDIELIDSENIKLTYLTGNDYTVVTEIISIDRDT